MTLYRWIHSNEPPDGWVLGSETLANDDGVIGWLVPASAVAIAQSDVPDGQADNWINTPVPEDGRYAVIRLGDDE